MTPPLGATHRGRRQQVESVAVVISSQLNTQDTSRDMFCVLSWLLITSVAPQYL